MRCFLMNLEGRNLVVAYKIQRLGVADVLKEGNFPGDALPLAQNVSPDGIRKIAGHILRIAVFIGDVKVDSGRCP